MGDSVVGDEHQAIASITLQSFEGLIWNVFPLLVIGLRRSRGS